jgi:hypothetical protein
MKRSFAVALASSMLVFLSIGCASHVGPASPISSDSICKPHFPYLGGWLGGDAAYSVAIPGHWARAVGRGNQEAAGSRGDGESINGESADRKTRRTLWLFGDSFVSVDAAERQPVNRKGSILIENSIAISGCEEGRFEIEYFWKRDGKKSPQPFFSAPKSDDGIRPKRGYWLFDGFVHKGALYVGLLEVEKKVDAATGLSFQLVGMRLAKVPNPEEPPDDWRFESSLLSDSLDAFPGSSMVIDGGYVYIFAFTRFGDRGQPRFLVRLSLTDLEEFPADLSEKLETLVSGGSWEPGFAPERALLLMDDNASEMSVEYDEGVERWVAVYGSPVQPGNSGRTILEPPSNRVFLRYAKALEGPWSEPVTIYRFPEMEAGAGYDPETVCYAAKGHLVFSDPGRVLIAYVCNLMSFDAGDPWATLERLSLDMRIYRPRTVSVPLPRSPDSMTSRDN